jgi:hypothetical protein
MPLSFLEGKSSTEEYVATGMSREEAERRTRLAYGGLDQIKEECREARGISLIEIVLYDTRFALRTLRKSPGSPSRLLTTTGSVLMVDTL